MAPDASPSSAGLWRVWRQDMARACVFLTRLPIRWPTAAPGEPDGMAALARALRCAPLVGALVGAAGATVLALAGMLGLPPLAAAGLALAATFAITGGLHEDGLADVADGFGGGQDTARKLAIMRDSYVGSYGVAAIVLSLLLRAGALTALAAVPGGALALIGAHALGRAAMLPVMRGLAPARADGLGHGAGRPTRAAVGTALGLGAGVALLTLGPLAGLVGLLVGALLTGVVARLAVRQVRGYTGDVLGAVEQTVETAVLLTAASLIGAAGLPYG